MLSVIFLVLASICNALIDTCQFHFEQSMIHLPGRKKWNQWWNPLESWKNKYKGRNYKLGRRMVTLFGRETPIKYPTNFTDAFHCFKTLMIVFIIIAITVFSILEYKTIHERLLFIIILGAAWNVTFTLVYNILSNKEVWYFNIFKKKD